MEFRFLLRLIVAVKLGTGERIYVQGIRIFQGMAGDGIPKR